MRTMTSTELMLAKRLQNKWLTRESMHDIKSIHEPMMEKPNEQRFPPTSPQFTVTWLVTFPMKPYLSLKPWNSLKGTCQKLTLFYSLGSHEEMILLLHLEGPCVDQGFSTWVLLTFHARQFSVVGAVMCIVECSAASLAPAY